MSTLLEELKQFLDVTETYHSLEALLVTAGVEVNELRKFMLVSRSVKSYDEDMGPYDALQMMVGEDDSYKCMISFWKRAQYKLHLYPIL